MAEANPEINSVRSSTTKVLRKRYKWLAILVGVPGVGDLVKEYVRSKTLEPVS